MKLGLKNDEVKIVPYTAEWHSEFLKVKEEIHLKAGISEDRIEHIGSTAIEDMLAKPIIDILVAVDDLAALAPSVIKSLRDIGFHRLKVERLNEIVFAKFTDDTYQEKTHFIHLVEHDKELWKNLIFFRDYLRANENARNEYLKLKMDYAKKSETGIKDYTDHKEAFVKNIFGKRTND